jgi:hypothetical protein
LGRSGAGADKTIVVDFHPHVGDRALATYEMIKEAGGAFGELHHIIVSLGSGLQRRHASYAAERVALTHTRLLNVNVPAKTGAPQKKREVAPFNHLRILTGILFAKNRAPKNNLGMSGGRHEIILFFCVRKPLALVNGCLPARFGALEKYYLDCYAYTHAF